MSDSTGTAKLFSPSTRGSANTPRTSKICGRRNPVSPRAIRLMAIPSTIGSPRLLTAPKANTSDTAIPAATANTTPTPLAAARKEPPTAANAPASIIPSREIWKTPARSQIIPPRAASKMGIMARNTESTSAPSNSWSNITLLRRGRRRGRFPTPPDAGPVSTGGKSGGWPPPR